MEPRSNNLNKPTFYFQPSQLSSVEYSTGLIPRIKLTREMQQNMMRLLTSIDRAASFLNTVLYHMSRTWTSTTQAPCTRALISIAAIHTGEFSALHDIVLVRSTKAL